MMKLLILFLGLGGSFGTAQVLATELSAQLTANEIKDAGAILGFGSMHRPWTAHSLPSSSLGLDMGIETGFAFRRNLLEQGNGGAVLPKTIPIPRLWLSWDFPFDLTFSASAAPGFLFDGITQYGGGLQWFFYDVPDFNTSVSIVGHYSYADSFSDLTTNTFGFDVQASRDLAIWQPYIGAGLLLTAISADARLPAAGVATGTYFNAKTHLFLGARIDLITKLSVQMDLCGSQASFGILLANTF